MKKLLITFLALMGIVLPSLAQVAHDFNPNDREPIVNVTITKDKVPVAILNAVNTQFNKDKPVTWSKFPYALKEYGWVYDVGSADLKLDRYAVQMKTDKGDDLWAAYDINGNLIETREILKNVPIPNSVMDEFSKSKYKDWKIVGNKEVIKFYHDRNNSSVEQHFRITVEKDKVRRSISFNWQGSN